MAGELGHAAVLKVDASRRLAAADEPRFTPTKFEVTVRVEPPGGEPFESTLRYEADIPGLVPHEGGTIPVLFDRERREAEWDEETARDEHVQRMSVDRERRERLAAERSAAGQPPVGTDGPDVDLMAELAALATRKDAGELSDWEFRQARAELMKSRGF